MVKGLSLCLNNTGQIWPPLLENRCHLKHFGGNDNEILWLFPIFSCPKRWQKEFSGRSVPWFQKRKSGAVPRAMGQVWPPPNPQGVKMTLEKFDDSKKIWILCEKHIHVQNLFLGKEIAIFAGEDVQIRPPSLWAAQFSNTCG